VDGGRSALCRTDGTEAGTERVVFGESWSPKHIVGLNNRVLFGAINAQSFPGDWGNYLVAINPDGPPMQNLQVTTVGNGRVQSDIAGIDCGTDCVESFDGGALITLTANPAPGETFIGWEGGIYGWSGDGMDCNIVSCDEAATTLTISMFIDRKITARFSSNTYTVTPKSSSFGSIMPSMPQVVDSGETITFTISPDFSFKARSVTGCGGALDGITYTTGPINADCTVSAEFLPPGTSCTAGNAILGPVTYSDGDLVAELAEGKLSTNGNVILKSGASVIYEAGASVELSSGFQAMIGSSFSADIKPISCE
jgi:hypothetical protein